MKFHQITAAHQGEVHAYADAYLANVPGDASDWRTFANDNAVAYETLLRRGWRYEFVSGQPYRYAVQMFADQRRGVLKVSTDFNTHTIWTPDQNLEFRAVHDTAHFISGGKFTWEGEKLACSANLRLYRHVEMARRVLESECLGQVAVAVRTDGKYPDQHEVNMDGVPSLLEV